MSLCLVVVASVVFQMSGLPIGAHASAAILSVILTANEARFRERYAHSAPLQWRRYVDDLLACSHRLCGDCILRRMREAIPLPITPTSGTLETASEPHIWVDTQLRPAGETLVVLMKSANRQFAHGISPSRSRPVFLPFLGTLPVGFAALRAVLAGRLSRGMQLKVAPDLISLRMMDDVMELFFLGYPLKLLRSLIFSLLVAVPTQALRAALRAWTRTASANGD